MVNDQPGKYVELHFVTSQRASFQIFFVCVILWSRYNFSTSCHVSGAVCSSEGEHGDVVLLRADSVRCLTHGTRQVETNGCIVERPAKTICCLNVDIFVFFVILFAQVVHFLRYPATDTEGLLQIRRALLHKYHRHRRQSESLNPFVSVSFYVMFCSLFFSIPVNIFLSCLILTRAAV